MKRIFAGAVATAVRHPTLSRQRGDHKDLGMRGLLEVRQSKVCAVHAPVIVDIDQPPKDRKIVYLLLTSTQSPSQLDCRMALELEDKPQTARP